MSIGFSPFGTNPFATSGTTALDTTGATSGSTNTGGVDSLDSSGTGSAYGLTTDDFMKLFLAQLTNQDPTKPMDDSQMLSQLSQMSMLQTFQGVQKTLEGSQLAQASALIGKRVTGMDVNQQPVDGVVTSVTQSTDAGLVLQVGSQYIKPDSVTVVTSPAATGTGS